MGLDTSMMRTTFNAALFDMDGVIVDTREAILQFWRAIAVRRGVALEDSFEQMHIHGRKAEHTIMQMFPTIDAEHMALLQEEVLAELKASETSAAYIPISGVVELLLAFRKRGVPMALVTGAEPWKAETVLSQLNLKDVFAAVVTAADVQRSKPDPAGYLLAARMLKVAPESCLVFEDSESGVMAGVAANALCIGIGSSIEELINAGARTVVKDFNECRLHASMPGEIFLDMEGGRFRYGTSSN